MKSPRHTSNMCEKLLPNEADWEKRTHTDGEKAIVAKRQKWLFPDFHLKIWPRREYKRVFGVNPIKRRYSFQSQFNSSVSASNNCDWYIGNSQYRKARNWVGGEELCLFHWECSSIDRLLRHVWPGPEQWSTRYIVIYMIRDFGNLKKKYEEINHEQWDWELAEDIPETLLDQYKVFAYAGIALPRIIHGLNFRNRSENYRWTF